MAFDCDNPLTFKFNLFSLQIEDKTMYQLYFGAGDDADFESVLLNAQFIYMINAANKMKPTFSAQQ